MFKTPRWAQVLGMGRSDSSRGRPPRRRERRFRPGVDTQPLEPRIAMSHAPVQLGAVHPGQNSVFSGSVARDGTKDYQFQVNASMIVGATLSGLSANAELILLNANKVELASFSNGKASDSFTYTFSPGDYYIRVLGLGRHKAKYQLEVTATALPAPTASSHPTTTAGGSTSGANGQESAQQLIAAVSSSIDQFLNDAATLEIHSPTLLASYGIDQDLVRIGSDMKTGPLLQVFADFQSLGQVAFQEAVDTIEYKQPARDALLGNSTVVSDLLTINGDKEQTYALLQALAKATGQHLSTEAQAVMSTGLFAPPASTSSLQNVVSSPTVSQFTSYSSPALSAEYAYYLNDQSNIESEADYYYNNYDYSTYSAGTG